MHKFFLLIFVFVLTSCGDESVLESNRRGQNTGEGLAEDADQKPLGGEVESPEDKVGEPSSDEERFEGLPETTFKVVDALHQYCASCHAIGGKRFIFDESRANTLEYIQNVDYKKGESWLAAIVASIHWEGGQMPPFKDVSETKNEKMPIGLKRHEFDEAKIDGKPMREVMLEVLSKSLK